MNSNDKENSNSAVLGCCVNYARVLFKENESVMRVHPRMKFEFLFRCSFSLATNLFLERLS